MSDTTIDINIPREYTSKFLGMLTLDILHDAKGKGYLYDHLLSNITDLLALSCRSHTLSESEMTLHESGPVMDLNLEKLENLKMYIFTRAYSFFHTLWIDNPSAFGDLIPPNFNEPFTNLNYWNSYKLNVKLPLRLVAERKDEDTFITLGKGKNSIEAENYRNELALLPETVIFESPRNISCMQDYLNKAQSTLAFIKHHLPNSLISLDMKSAAGLLRTITDPVGYITGLPTYCDPGYNMIGMSAIRDASPVEFTSKPRGSNFTFRIRIPDLVNEHFTTGSYSLNKNLTLLKTEYYYGGREDLARENVLVKILDDYHYSHLPSASIMANSLCDYLNVRNQMSVTRSTEEILHTIKSCLYDSINTDNVIEASLNILLTIPSKNVKKYLCKIAPVFGIEIDCINDWFLENKMYLIKILLIVQYYSSGLKDGGKNQTLSDLLPENILTQKIIENKGFAYNFFNILEKLSINPEFNFKRSKKNASIKRNVNKQLNDQYIEFINSNKSSINSFIENCITQYKLNFKFNEDYNYAPKNIVIPKELENYLNEYIHIYYPHLYHVMQTGFKPHDQAFYHFALIDVIINSSDYYETINTENTFSIPASRETIEENAIFNVLGKFSGDFGQIAWCIANGHIFASEDNNASALALVMHQMYHANPNCFVTQKTLGWGSIHGMGDGGTVNVTISN